MLGSWIVSQGGLLISEYAEGSSHNKYLELYNAGSAAVPLAPFGLASVGNAPKTPGTPDFVD